MPVRRCSSWFFAVVKSRTIREIFLASKAMSLSLTGSIVIAEIFVDENSGSMASFASFGSRGNVRNPVTPVGRIRAKTSSSLLLTIGSLSVSTHLPSIVMTEPARHP